MRSVIYNNQTLFLVKTLHLSITAFVVFAWLAPSMTVRIIHLIFVPLVILHWKTNGGRCVLSDIERVLQATPVSDEESSPFIKGIFRWISGSVPSDRVVVNTTYLIMIISWSISAAIVLYMS